MKTNNDEQKLLLSKIKDIVALSEKRKSVCESAFLDPAEAIYVKRSMHMEDTMVFYGGYEDAERVVFANLMPWSELSDIKISCVRVNTGARANLNHRDYLGSVLALGIERNVIGDICVNENGALMFVKSDICDYIVMNLTKIGKYSVSCEEYLGDLKEFIQKRCEVRTVNVSSLRLDTFVSAVYNMSRTNASALINSKNVKLNYEICVKPDAKMCENDLVSVRGYGRVRFIKAVGKSRKDRLYLEVCVYV